MKHAENHRSIISHIKRNHICSFYRDFPAKGKKKKTTLDPSQRTRISLSTVMDVERAEIDRNHPDPERTRPTLAAVHHLLPEGNHLCAGRKALYNAWRWDSWNNEICPFMLQLADLSSNLHILCGSLTV